MGNNSQSDLANRQQHDLRQRERAEAMLRELQGLALADERVKALTPEEVLGAYQAYYDSVAVCCKKWEPLLFGAYYTTAGAAGCACIGGALLNPLTASVGGAVGMTVGAVEAARAISEIERALKSSLPMRAMEEDRVKSKSFGNLAESVFRQSKPHRTYSASHTFTSAGQMHRTHNSKYSSAYFCIIGNILFRGRPVDSLRKSLLLCSEQGSTCEWKVD